MASRKRLWPFALFALLLIAYVPALRGLPLMDDRQYVFDNPAMKSVAGLGQFWAPFGTTDFWPVFYSVLWFLHQIFGDSTWGYHFVNVAVHAANSVLLHRILARYRLPNPWLPVALFAFHPVMVQSVAWMFQLKTTLATLLFFSAYLLYLPKEDEDGPRAVGSRYMLSIASFVAAMLVKTSVALFPLAIALHHAWKRDMPAKLVLKAIAPYLAVGMAFGSFTLMLNETTLSGQVNWNPDGRERILTSAWHLWFYLGKLVYPRDLAFTYPWKSLDPAIYVSSVPLIALFALIGAIVRWGNSGSRILTLAGGYYLLNLLPALGLVNIPYMRFSLVSDQWQYLAAPGVFALAGAFPLSSRANRAACTFAIVTLGALTFAQARLYESPLVLWQDTVRKDPGSILGNFNLSAAYHDLGRTDDAIAALKQALSGPTKAPEYLVKSLRLEVSKALAMSYERAGRLVEARDQYASALTASPGDLEVRNALCELDKQLGDADRLKLDCPNP